MARLVSYPWIRSLATFLVAWICIDGALYGVCAADMITAAAGGQPTVSNVGTTSHDDTCQPGHHHHAAHCFCHAHWVRMTAALPLFVLAESSSLVDAAANRGPESPARGLDHPPQLAAL
jgi:hypothetical protein